jgi:hypothetical protein
VYNGLGFWQRSGFSTLRFFISTKLQKKQRTILKALSAAFAKLLLAAVRVFFFWDMYVFLHFFFFLR